jgi:thiamine pyrophosphokinase
MGPQIPNTLLSHPILGVDGGAHFASKLDIWVGDADSYPLPINIENKFTFPTKKEASDLTLALRLFVNMLPYKFHFWGFLGGRKDHELFNIGEALTFLDAHPHSQILFYSEQGKLSFHMVGTGHWKFFHEGLFTIGSIKKVALSLKGACDFPIPKQICLSPLSSLGLSNFARGEMTLYNEGPVFIYYPEGK